MRRIWLAVVAMSLAACGASGGTPQPSSVTPTAAPTLAPTATPIATAALGPSPSPGSSAVASRTGRIAYVLGPEGARDLHVVAPDGTGDASCGTGMAPSWTADGSAMVFAGPVGVNADGFEFPDVYRSSADCSDVARLFKEGAAPHLSPDGASVTFGRGVIDTGDAWIAKADGSGQRNLMTGTSPTWSPDGAWLLLNPDTGAYELGLIKPDGSGYHSLGLGTDPAWTPDGRIVYLRSDYPKVTTTVRVIALDGAATDLFTAPGDLASPRMLADGTVVFIVSGDAWRLDPGSKEPVRLTHGLMAASGLSVSSDGRWIAVGAGGTLPGLVVMSVGGEWTRILPGIVTDVAWQPAAFD